MDEYIEVKSAKFFPPTDTCFGSKVVTEINVKLAQSENIVTLTVPVSIKRDSYDNFSIESELVADSFIHYAGKNSDYFENLSDSQARDVFACIVNIAKEVTIAVAQLRPY